MIDPATLFLAGQGLNLASTIPQWLLGKKQEDRANQLASNLQRPIMTVPESQLKALESAKAQSTMTRLPNQSAIEGRLDQTTANTLAMLERLSTGGAMGINAAARAYGNQMDAENKLGENAANMYLRNQDIYRNELGETAQWENQAWQWNQMQPYLQSVNAIEALRQGGIQNRYGAAMDSFGVAGNALQGMGLFFNNDMSWLNNVFSPNQQPASVISGNASTGLKGIDESNKSVRNILDLVN